MDREVSLEDLAERTGEPVARLGEWRSVGLIGSEDGERFRHDDVARVRLIQLFLRRGIDLQTIAETAGKPVFSRLLSGYLDKFASVSPGPAFSLTDAADRLGLDVTVLRRFHEALGEPEGYLEEQEIEFMKGWRRALEAGLPEEAIVQLLRVYADALGRVGEAEVRLVHFYVHERLRAAGLPVVEATRITEAASEQLLPLAEPAVLYFHRGAFARAWREDLVTHLEEEAGLAGTVEVPGQLQAAIVFVDLSNFGAMSEAMGDEAAAAVLNRFSELVREAVHRWHGRLVKQIGDAFMLVFRDPTSAVACALEIETRAVAEPQFPAVRSGVQWGSVLYREGDYLGSNVNIAARLAAEAQRHQVLVTTAVRRAATGLAEVEFAPVGRRRLKGLADDQELFEARRAEVVSSAKVVDPVCGMELQPQEAAARLSLQGKERAFCSEECLRRFMAAPQRYSR